ncbi:MAG: hypothetical protein IJH71_01455 [Eubacterium sp.]|nr:hypothetical protein [Eubacterium sp.]
MTDQELRKLKRSELLQIMVAQGRRIEELEKELQEKEQQLKDKRILLQESGNIAEAALKLNRIFEDAQEAAEQYLMNIQRLGERKAGIPASQSPELSSRRRGKHSRPVEKVTEDGKESQKEE